MTDSDNDKSQRYSFTGTALGQAPLLGASEADAGSDDALVNAARNGDIAAFETLMQRYNRICLANANLALRNRADAEEEVQNTWTKVWARLWQYEGPGSFAGWLRRILANQCLIRIRDRRRARLISMDNVYDNDGQFRLEIIDQRSLPDDVLGEAQVAAVVQHEIRRLPNAYRKTLVLRDLRRQPMEEIADHLGISVPAAKSRLMRGRITLRKRMEAKHTGQHGPSTLLARTSLPRAAYVRVV